jgi:hypothetical protein
MATKCVMLGVPESGKSTYLAALRFVLNADEANVALRSSRLSASEGHLNNLEKRWAACERVGRTQPATQSWVTLYVDDRKGTEAELLLPDWPGETFTHPVASGSCRKDVVESMREADALMLFTSADKGDDDSLIEDFDDVVQTLGTGSDAQTLKEFDPLAIPEEPALVELLQVINRVPRHARSRKLAVCVSAWDVVAGAMEPAKWLAANRPMLSQYLEFNPRLWDVHVYGISAQGGELPRDRDALLGKNPIERVKIVVGSETGNDLTLPVKWLMGS